MKPRILLTTLNAKYIHLNLAIRILYDLNKDKCDLHWKEFVIKNPVEEIVAYCKGFDIICFSCYIWNITPTLKACEALKQAYPDIKILLGGPEVSYDWEPVIAQDYIDYIIAGEGEVPFGQFVQQYPHISGVANLVFKQDEHIHFNKQNVQFDISLLANRNPYQYDPVADLSNKVCYIETSRGCPYKCEFCLASLDNKVRYLPMDTIKSNLLYLMQHGKTIKFLDRTFNIKKDFSIELFQFILDNHSPGNVFQFEITADIVHPDIIRFINEKVPKDLFRFEIGIQTVNQESNRAVSRKQNFEKTSSIIKQLDERIEMHLDLIVGLPLEYWDDLKFSFESTFKLYPPELQLGFLKFLKGTPVREKYEEHGYVFDPEPPYQIIKSNFLSSDELKAITQLEDALEIYWNKKRAVHTLQYIAEEYSIFDFLLGLGTYFHQVSDPHKHTLKDIYQIIYEYTKSHYNDAFLMQLLTIDYYSYYKVKPQDLYEAELSKKASFEVIDSLGLNHHQYRFAVLPAVYDFDIWQTQRKRIEGQPFTIIQFNGTEKAQPLALSLNTAKSAS